MPSCLGIYIQNNLIKYAKISKERDNTKVEAYGVKFYETDIEKVIEQIVQETYSYQVPISVNIRNESYTYANIFNLLKTQDLEKAINTEFEYFCNNNNKNKNTIEFRRIKVPNFEDRDKKRVIYTYVDKSRIVETIQLFDKYKIHNIYPTATIMQNINKVATQGNSIIVNLEEETEITTIQNGEIYKVDKIQKGMSQVLKPIHERENSFKKAYDICKNTTVYTKSGQNLKIDGNEYLDEIITTLFEIIEQIKETIKNNEVQIDNIYLTGMGILINNIDLLFQENFIDKKCEILIPYFVEKTNIKINIKDYIEVNSAMALALQGLNAKDQEVNFNNKGKSLKKVWEVLNSDVKKGKGIKLKSNKPKKTVKEVVNSELDLADKLLLRGVTGLALIIIFYIGSTQFLSKKINEKISLTQDVIDKSNEEIASIQNYTSTINARTSEYQKIVQAINEANDEVSNSYASKNAIPNLLNRIMYNIPKGVQLLSIQNSSGKKITIEARAEKYDQLGYFKAVLEEEGILTNIQSTKGTNDQKGITNITITGQLPY